MQLNLMAVFSANKIKHFNRELRFFVNIAYFLEKKKKKIKQTNKPRAD